MGVTAVLGVVSGVAELTGRVPPRGTEAVAVASGMEVGSATLAPTVRMNGAFDDGLHHSGWLVA